MLKAGAPFPIGYASFDQNTGLFLRAHVFNITGGSPIAVGTVNLFHEGFGCYSAVFAGGADGDLYSVDVLAYDATYTTIDTDRPPSKSEKQFVDLGAAVSESTAPGELIATIDEDEEFLATLECEED